MIRTINHIAAIRCVNFVMNAIWIEMNYSGTYGRNITFVTFAMQMVQIIFMRKYPFICWNSIQFCSVYNLKSDCGCFNFYKKNTGMLRAYVTILMISTFCAKREIAKRTFSQLFFVPTSISKVSINLKYENLYQKFESFICFSTFFFSII